MTDTSAIAALGDVPAPPNPLDTVSKYQSILNAQTLQQLQQQETQNLQTTNLVNRASLASHLQGALGGWTYAWGNDPDMDYAKAQDQFNLVRTQNPQLAPLVDALSQRVRPDMSPDQVRQAFRNFGFASEAPHVQQQMNDPYTHIVTINGVAFPFTVPRAGNQYGQSPIPVQSWGGAGLVGPQSVQVTDKQGRPIPALAYPQVYGAPGSVGVQPGAQPGVRSSDGTTPSPVNPPRLNAQPAPSQNGWTPAPTGKPSTAATGTGPDYNPPVSAGAAIGGSPSALPVPPVPPANAPAAPTAAPPAVQPANPQPAAPPVAAKPAVPPAPPPPVVPGKPFAANNSLLQQPIQQAAVAAAQPSVINRLLGAINPIGTAEAQPVVPNPNLAGRTPTYSQGIGQTSDNQAGIVASSKKMAEDDVAATTYLNQRLPFEESLRLYDGGNVTTGPMSGLVNEIEGGIRSLGAKVLGLKSDTNFDTNERYDGIKKWEANIATTSGFAGQSVAHLDTVLQGSANVGINEQAAIKMLKTGVVMRNAYYAINQAWHSMTPEQQAAASPQGTYLGYIQQAQRNTDLRAFALPYLSGKEWDTLMAQEQKMTPQDRARFEASMKLADAYTPGAGQVMPLPKGQ